MKTKHLTAMAMYLALIILSGLLIIPTPVGVPIVLQNMVCAMAGAVLGKKHGTLTVLVFLLCIALGLPVLPGGRGGAAVFLGATGSYFIGYLLSPYFVGLALEKVTNRSYVTYLIVFVLFGALLINFSGLLSLYNNSESLSAAFKTMIAFIPVDLIKAVPVAWVAQRIYVSKPRFLKEIQG